MTPTPTATVLAPELLRVRDLTVGVGAGPSAIDIVEDFSLDVGEGETVALVGESGCGKTTAALSLMGLQPPVMTIRSGSVDFAGSALTELTERAFRRLRGGEMAMIFQDPMSGLNPLRRVGHQISEAIRIHQTERSRDEARTRAVDLLRVVGIPDPERRASQYPHEFSGGMRQRAMIAMAIANQPRLLIADEPTTALDVTIQAQIIELLMDAKRSSGAALLLVTHDIGLVGELADRVAVMYAGRLVEIGPTADVLTHPQHPYTVGLLDSVPLLGRRDVSLVPIPGQAPLPSARPSGCPFHPRCAVGRERDRCASDQPALIHHGDIQVACHFPGELLARVPTARPPSARAPEPLPLLSAAGVHVEFPVRRGVLQRTVGRVRAVDGVDLEIAAGETVAIVGESGSGKSTFARAIVGLSPVKSGSIELAGLGDVVGRSHEPSFRRRVQLVFQDPYASLNPRMRVGASVGEPLRVHQIVPRANVSNRVAELFALVGLDESLISRYPHELSGGQRQRIGLARALALEPELLILDEPVSALDVSVQAQILTLLIRLREELGLAYLIIAHDLALVEQIADRVAVMYFGRLVEFGSTEDVLTRPGHPYTRALIASTPGQTSSGARESKVRGEPPSPLAAPSGCAFRSRCAFAIDKCAAIEPPLVPVPSGSTVACMRSEEILTMTQDSEASGA